jgi:small subunit ribosomal protein S1
MANDPPTWEQFKREHPPGSEITGTVRQAAPFGVFVDLGVPFTALLEVPYIAPVKKRKSYPEDYPKVGDVISVLIRHYGDQITPEGVGQIALTQDPESLWTMDAG